VVWIEKLQGNRWRVHGTNTHAGDSGQAFTVEAANVVLAAGSINSTELILRSQMHGLSLSPQVGSRFSCNGDFFAVAYNSDFRTQIRGFGNYPEADAAHDPPGPAIVSGIHYFPVRPLKDASIFKTSRFRARM
jgi:cholesterol oxidase